MWSTRLSLAPLLLRSSLVGPLLASTQRLPSVCAVCHGWGRQRVCARCVQRFAGAVSRCVQCALRVPEGVERCGACVVDPPPFVRTLAAVDYDHPWDGLITRFKFHGGLDLAASLAQRLQASFDAGGFPRPDLLLPVPLAAERLRERGFNQAWELTRRVARAIDGACEPNLLLRLKDTPHQLALPIDRRAGNVRAAFAVEPRRRAELQGRSIALVDDVMTTGATVAELARVLLQAGAKDVSVWVVARTPRTGAL
jgi:ComF family protein